MTITTEAMRLMNNLDNVFSKCETHHDYAVLGKQFARDMAKIKAALGGQQAQMIDKITVPAQPGLDPISIYFDDLSPGAGRVILVCYDMAWQGYWGSIGSCTIKQFFLSCGADYLQSSIGTGISYKRGTRDVAYLKRIIHAAQDYLKDQANG